MLYPIQIDRWETIQLLTWRAVQSTLEKHSGCVPAKMALKITKESKTQPLQSGTLLILGSAPEVVSIVDQKLPAGCDLLAVNNA